MKYYCLIILVLFASCKKEIPTPEYLATANWCGQKTAWYGDSFVAAPGAWPAAYFLADYIGADVFVPITPTYGMAGGEALVYNAGYSGKTSTYIKDQFMRDVAHRDWCQVFWLGRNNSWDTAQICKDLDEMIAHLPHNNYIIIGILTGDWESEWKGTAFYNNVHAYNAYIAQRFKGHVIDPLTLLHGNRSLEDILCEEHGVSPASLRVDELHLNSTGEKQIGEGLGVMVRKCSSLKFSAN